MNRFSVSLACRTRRLMGVSTDETAKTEAACHSRSGTIKMPPCHKAISADQRAYVGNGLSGRKTIHITHSC